jgi:hypothetical protein
LQLKQLLRYNNWPLFAISTLDPADICSSIVDPIGLLHYLLICSSYLGLFVVIHDLHKYPGDEFAVLANVLDGDELADALEKESPAQVVVGGQGNEGASFHQEFHHGLLKAEFLVVLVVGRGAAVVVVGEELLLGLVQLVFAAPKSGSFTDKGYNS